MNPLDLTGPAFLIFYLIYGTAACRLLHVVNRSREPQSPTGPVPQDPLVIAYLRDGFAETLRVATVMLMESGVLLLAPDKTLLVSKKNPLPPSASAVDRAVYDHFADGGDDARSIFTSGRLEIVARAAAEPPLEAAGLIPDAGMREARRGRLRGAILALALPALLKVAVALSRGHSNVGLLVIAAGIFGFIAFRIAQRHRTPAGDAALEYLARAFEPVRTRLTRQRDLPATDVAVVAAVFGLGALPIGSYAHTAALAPRQQSGGCGGGCSGGDGGGGGCGGGCGGCG